MKPNGYSLVQICLHWAVAMLVLFNYLYSEGMGRAFDARMEGLPLTDAGLNPSVHVWVGVSVLVLVLLRLVVRATAGAPDAGGSGRMQTVATWGHKGLYLLLLLVPALGAVTWFAGVEATADLHALVANALMLAAAGHALIALWHQFIRKDGLLLRMVRPCRM